MARLIGFNGKMFAGKSVAIDALKANTKKDVENFKFAQPLYDIQEFMYSRIGQPIPYPKDRKLLQWLGTEWGREKDTNLWVNIWKQEVGEYLERSPTAIATCDDCRFDNEAAIIKGMGGIIVQITAPEATRTARAKELGMTIVNHASENGISEKYVDYIIENDTTAQDLYTKVEALVKRLGIG
jgi:hypothetical protein